MLKKRMSTIFRALMPHSLVESFFTRCKFDKGDAYQLSIVNTVDEIKGRVQTFQECMQICNATLCVFKYKDGVNLVHCESVIVAITSLLLVHFEIQYSHEKLKLIAVKIILTCK